MVKIKCPFLNSYLVIIQNFSKVGQATKSLELGSKKTLQLFIKFFIFANNQKFQKIRLD